MAASLRPSEGSFDSGFAARIQPNFGSMYLSLIGYAPLPHRRLLVPRRAPKVHLPTVCLFHAYRTIPIDMMHPSRIAVRTGCAIRPQCYDSSPTCSIISLNDICGRAPPVHKAALEEKNRIYLFRVSAEYCFSRRTAG